MSLRFDAAGCVTVAVGSSDDQRSAGERTSAYRSRPDQDADHANFYNRVLDDVVQIAFGSQSYIGGKFQRSEVVSLPFGAESKQGSGSHEPITQSRISLHWGETGTQSLATFRPLHWANLVAPCGSMLRRIIEREFGMKEIWGVCGLASAILLGGCSVLSQFTIHRPSYGNQASWNKQGASSQEATAALSDCNGEARASTERDTNITTDILATRPNTWSNTAGPIGTQSQYFSGGQGQLFDNQDRDLSASIVNECMTGKGFAPGN